MPEFMTSEEFIQQCLESGYVSRRDKKRLREWVENHPQDFYTESDFIDIYRYFEEPRHGDKVSGGKWRYTWDGHKTTKHYDDD